MSNDFFSSFFVECTVLQLQPPSLLFDSMVYEYVNTSRYMKFSNLHLFLDMRLSPAFESLFRLAMWRLLHNFNFIRHSRTAHSFLSATQAFGFPDLPTIGPRRLHFPVGLGRNLTQQLVEREALKSWMDHCYLVAFFCPQYRHTVALAHTFILPFLVLLVVFKTDWLAQSLDS